MGWFLAGAFLRLACLASGAAATAAGTSGRDGARRLSEVRRRSRLLLVEHHLGGFERLAE